MHAFTLLVGEAYWSQELHGGGDVIAFAILAAHGPTEPATRRAATWGVTLPCGFDAWFAQATALDPARRYQTAGEAVRALGEALGSAPGVTAVLPPLPSFPLQTRPSSPPTAPTPVPTGPSQPSPSLLLTPVPTGLPTGAPLTVVQPRRPHRALMVASVVAATSVVALCIVAWVVLRGDGPGDAVAPSVGAAPTVSAASPPPTSEATAAAPSTPPPPPHPLSAPHPAPRLRRPSGPGALRDGGGASRARAGRQGAAEGEAPRGAADRTGLTARCDPGSLAA